MSLAVHEHQPIIDDALAPWRDTVGSDWQGYRNHAYRVFNFCRALNDAPAAADGVAVAAAFHDLGIWPDRTLDYLEPSAGRAEAYMAERSFDASPESVRAMIMLHHKLRGCTDPDAALTEPFRQADLVDLSLGTIRCGLPREFVRDVRSAFPNAGFHGCLARLMGRSVLRHPLRPMPMLRW